MFLGVPQDFRSQMNVPWFVDPMDVAKGGRDSETIADFHQFFIGVSDLFGLGVQSVGVNLGVVDAVFFTTSDPQLEF